MLSNQPSPRPRQSTLPFVLSDKPSYIPVDEDEPVRKNPFKLDKSRPSQLFPDTKSDIEPTGRKELRRSLCGHRIGTQFRAENGMYYKGTYHCDLWRDDYCPRCAAYRSTKYKKQKQKAFVRANEDGRKLKKITVDKSGARSLCAKLKKDEYQRLPQDDDKIVFLVDSDKNTDGVGESEELSWEALDEIDWDALVQTPDNQRITGSLGRKASAMDDDEVEIKAPRFTVHPQTTPEQEIEALTKTFEETSHLNPQTPEELEAALEERTKIFVAKLKEAGGKLLHRINHSPMKVRISRISWEVEYTDYMIRDMVHVENMPPEIPLVD